MIKTIVAIVFCLAAAAGNAAPSTPGSLMLLNDSPFILTATVYAKSGEYLGQVTIQPGAQSNFTTNLSSTGIDRPGMPSVSITPYRVVWQCASGGYYSMCASVATGSLVRANECPGLQYCNPKKDESAKQVQKKKTF